MRENTNLLKRKRDNFYQKLGSFGLFFILLPFTPFILEKLNFYGSSHANVVDTAKKVIDNANLLTTPLSYGATVDKAAPAVVSIKTSRKIAVEENPLMRDPFFRQFFGDFGLEGQNGNPETSREQQGLGSGVIVDSKGHILTNYHVIKEVDEISVSLADGRDAKAKVVGSDPESDIAVLKIDLKNLPVILMGTSNQVRSGDVVLAIGNPFGLDQSVSLGIISATKRNQTGLGLLQNLIQTDAAINPGNSGGALVNTHGELIGINTAIFSQTGGHQGIGFAIPIDLAKEAMLQLMTGKPISRGFIGIQMQNLNDEIRESFNYPKGDGVFVRALVHGSPAQKAGLAPGDIILKIDGTPVKDSIEMQLLVKKLIPNKLYTVEIYRQKEIMSFSIKMGEKKIQSLDKRKK